MSNFETEALMPLAITIERLTAGAQGADSVTHSSELSPGVLVPSGSRLRPFIEILISGETPDILDLSEEYFGLQKFDEQNKPRVQPDKELIVLVVEHLRRSLEAVEFGAAVLNGSPHLYDGTHWTPITDQECAHLLGILAEHMRCGSITSRHFLFREKLLKQYVSNLWIEIASGSDDDVLVNFLNGTLDIADGAVDLREFRKDDFLTYQLPFDFSPSAECQNFTRYLKRVLPDETSQLVLAEFIGWIFLPGLKLEKILLLYGEGHNGKSVFFDIMIALLGAANISNLGLSALSKLENRFQLASKLLNFGSEINDRCDPDLLKKMASGEPVEARRLYKDVFIMRRYARLAFNANVLPRNTEQTMGFFRRFLIIPFTQTITEAEKDPDLASKIISSELPGIFNWVMEGLKRLRSNRKFTECVAALEALAAYRLESDSVAMFLDDSALVKSVDGRLGKNDLYLEYRGYCQLSGFSPLSKVNFGKRLTRHHQVSESKSGGLRFWHLIRTDDDA